MSSLRGPSGAIWSVGKAGLNDDDDIYADIGGEGEPEDPLPPIPASARSPARDRKQSLESARSHNPPASDARRDATPTAASSTPGASTNPRPTESSTVVLVPQDPEARGERAASASHSALHDVRSKAFRISSPSSASLSPRPSIDSIPSPATDAHPNLPRRSTTSLHTVSTSPDLPRRDRLSAATRATGENTVIRVEAPVLAKKLWQHREDVVAASILEGMEKKEIKRQEIIHELMHTEESYYADVRTLYRVYASGLRASNAATLMKGGPPLLDTSMLAQLDEASKQLMGVSERLSRAMQARVAEALIVLRMDDIIAVHLPALEAAFTLYSDVSVQMRRALTTATPQLQSVIDFLSAGRETRSLPMQAFLLAPVQRLARYPLLLGSILDATVEGALHADTLQTKTKLTGIVKACNDRIRGMEELFQLQDLEVLFDYSRLSAPFLLVRDGVRVVPTRVLLKQGPFELLDVVNGKVHRKSVVEFFLFSDFACYGRRVKAQGKTRYLIFRQMHRSYFDVLPDVGNVAVKPDQKEGLMCLYVYAPEGTATLHLLAPTPHDKARWVDAFEKKKENEEDLYSSVDCPRVRALYDYVPEQPDELAILVGDTIDVLLSRDDGWMKGRLVTPRSSDDRAGWFPASTSFGRARMSLRLGRVRAVRGARWLRQRERERDGQMEREAKQSRGCNWITHVISPLFCLCESEKSS